MLTKTEKKNLRAKINRELDKYSPNEELLKEWGKQLYELTESEKREDMFRMGRPSKYLHKFNLDLYRELKEDGLSDGEIEEMWGWGRGTIFRIKRRLGMPIKESNKKQISKERYKMLVDNGWTIADICRKEDLSRRSLYNARKRWGLLKYRN